MRMYLLTLIVVSGLGLTTYVPFVGVILWHWLSLMNPHLLTYGGFAGGLPLIITTAVVTLLSWLVSAEPKKPPMTKLAFVYLFFVVWMSIGTLFAYAGPQAVDKWDETMRKLIMVAVTMAMMTTQARLIIIVTVATMSVGFFGVKGGIFSILTGGSGQVLGPMGSMFQDNNSMGLGLLTILPLWGFLVEITADKRLRQVLIAGAGLIVIAILLTYSRGALVGLVVLGMAIWTTSKRKVLLAGLTAAAVLAGTPFMPEKWFARMDTINTYEEDASATSRLRQWHLGIEIAKDHPFFGGGFKAFVNRQLNDRYTPIVGPGHPFEAHSNYFQVLGEHGIVGFILYMTLIVGSLIACIKLYLTTRKIPKLFKLNRLSRALFLGLIGFSASGAFLSRADFDLFYLLIGIIISCSVVVRQALRDGLPAEPTTAREWLLAALKPPSRRREPRLAAG